MDTGCNYRSGARHGPRAVRHESALIRYMNITGALPYESLKVADIGDVPIVPYNLQRSMQIITEYYHRIMAANCIPLTMGGDHSLSYPILRAIREKHGPVGVVQIDAHPDFYDTLSGEKYANGTAFRRAVEEGLVDPKHMYQIGLRGSMDKGEDAQFEWAQKQVCIGDPPKRDNLSTSYWLDIIMLIVGALICLSLSQSLYNEKQKQNPVRFHSHSWKSCVHTPSLVKAPLYCCSTTLSCSVIENLKLRIPSLPPSAL